MSNTDLTLHLLDDLLIAHEPEDREDPFGYALRAAERIATDVNSVLSQFQDDFDLDHAEFSAALQVQEFLFDQDAPGKAFSVTVFAHVPVPTRASVEQKAYVQSQLSSMFQLINDVEGIVESDAAQKATIAQGAEGETPRFCSVTYVTSVEEIDQLEQTIRAAFAASTAERRELYRSADRLLHDLRTFVNDAAHEWATSDEMPDGLIRVNELLDWYGIEAI